MRKLLIFLTLSLPLLTFAQQATKPTGLNPTTTPTWFIDPTTHRLTAFSVWYNQLLTVNDTASLVPSLYQLAHRNWIWYGTHQFNKPITIGNQSTTPTTPTSGVTYYPDASNRFSYINSNGRVTTYASRYPASLRLVNLPYLATTTLEDSTHAAGAYVKKSGDTMTGGLFITNNSTLTVGDSISAYPHPSAILTQTVLYTDTSSHGYVDRRRQNGGKSDAQFDDQFKVLDGKDYTGKHMAGFQMNLTNEATLAPTNIYGYINTVTNNGGNISNFYGTFINNPGGTGTYSSKFGVYISPMSGASTNNYALFVASNTSKSYLGGSVLINKTTETPASYLTVKSLATGHRVVTFENTLGNEIMAFFNRASGDGQININNSTGTTGTLWDGGATAVNYYAGYLNAGFTNTTQSARVHIAAGTATAATAPLKIDGGTVLATTEAGAIENNGTHLFYTATNGGTRFQLDQQTGGSANPTGTVGFAAVNGSATTYMRSDGAPKIDTTRATGLSSKYEVQSYKTTTQSTSVNMYPNWAGVTNYVTTSLGSYLPLSGGTMTGNITMGGNSISGTGYTVAQNATFGNLNALSGGGSSTGYASWVFNNGSASPLTMEHGNHAPHPNDGYLYLLGGAYGTYGRVLTDNTTPLFAPVILSTTTGVNAKIVAVTTLYTVPTGKTCVVTGVDIIPTAATAVTNGGSADIYTVTTQDIFPTQTLTTLTSTGKVFTYAGGGMAVTAAAAATIKYNQSVGATGTALTYTVVLRGYLF